jgi:lipopolysaccharide export system permease protein
VPLIYALPIVTVIICAMVLQGWIRLAPPAALTALGASIRARFSRRAAA